MVSIAFASPLAQAPRRFPRPGEARAYQKICFFRAVDSYFLSYHKRLEIASFHLFSVHINNPAHCFVCTLSPAGFRAIM
jgi:hypothetical protein